MNEDSVDKSVSPVSWTTQVSTSEDTLDTSTCWETSYPGLNSHKDGDMPNSDTCPKFTNNCFEFDETTFGQVAISSCPTGYYGNVSILCSKDKQWEALDSKNCSLKELSEILESIKDPGDNQTLDVGELTQKLRTS
ncbi:unnamed protein product, partial [Lymnaea stagnalis]